MTKKTVKEFLADVKKNHENIPKYIRQEAIDAVSPNYWRAIKKEANSPETIKALKKYFNLK